jgi:hypothetical protein
MAGPASLIPLDHLEYLLKKHFKKAIKLVGGDDERAEALEKIEAVAPGTKAALLEIWRVRGTQAIHLWRLPFLKTVTATQGRAMIERVRGNKLGNGLHEFPGTLTAGGESRLLRLRVTDQAVTATVRRAIARTSTFEGEERLDLHQTDTDLILVFDGSGILEVYATHTNARSAAQVFIESVWGMTVPPPKQKKDRAKILAPIDYKESTVLSLVAKLKIDQKQTSLTGPDAEGRFGDITYNGKGDGTLTAPLIDDPRSVAQSRSVNHIRDYRMTHKYADGFTHDSIVQFYMKSKHPHVNFRTKTGRPAARHIIDELCRLVPTP